jgi:hypothetical protein
VTINGKWLNLMRMGGRVGIDAATIEFGVGEGLVQVFYERLLQRRIPEVPKTERS